MAFFLKLSYSKVRASFTPRQGRPSLVDVYSACNVSYTLHYMFVYRPRNIGIYVRVHRDTENSIIIVIFAENTSFRSYGGIC